MKGKHFENEHSQDEQDEYRDTLTNELIRMESDPINRKLLAISIPFSHILSYLIKGFILFASWFYTIYWINNIFKYFNLTHYFYFFMSFCLGGLSPVILQYAWKQYITYDIKKKGDDTG